LWDAFGKGVPAGLRAVVVEGASVGVDSAVGQFGEGIGDTVVDSALGLAFNFSFIVFFEGDA
jgi:hypothetical protein